MDFYLNSYIITDKNILDKQTSMDCVIKGDNLE